MSATELNLREVILESRLKRFLLAQIRKTQWEPSLTDEQALVLLAIKEAASLGLKLNQNTLGSLLSKSKQSLSQTLKEIREKEYCVVDESSNSRQGQFHRVTELGEKALINWMLQRTDEPELPEIVTDDTERAQLVHALLEQQQVLSQRVAREVFGIEGKTDDPDEDPCHVLVSAGILLY